MSSRESNRSSAISNIPRPRCGGSIDFEHERRREVIQHLDQKYGRDRVALTATVIIYRPKSAIRNVGKALGFDIDTLDMLPKSHQWWDGGTVNAERLVELGLSRKTAPTFRWRRRRIFPASIINLNEIQPEGKETPRSL